MVHEIVRFIQDLRLTDIFDIAIITIFIYMILVWLQKSRARFMFIGMVIMGLIYVLARLFGLYLTSMALQAFFAVALIMVVVIFQDDFRHFFERLAMIGAARKHRIATSFASTIDVLASATANLSRKKIGALIVIRGRDPLDRHLEAGVNVNGALSQVLLETIFDRHVPSHDGAVIVEAQQITKFGSYLPLSANIKEIGRLGTRHAAGLGLTERTDALCLIVSEEQGSISIAEDGKIKHLKDPAQLHNVLADFYNRKFPEKKGAALSNFLTRHLLEKILAVILASGLWLVFGHRTETIRRDFAVPIEYRNLASNVIVKEPKPKDVTVTLSGTEQEFNLLKSKELKISLDASNVKDGENIFPITKDLMKNPGGFSVVNVDPNEIHLNTYRVITVSTPVEIKTKGRPSADIVIKSMKIEPRDIQVIVPSTMVKDKIFITTEPIDLKSIAQTTTVAPALVLPENVRFPEDKNPDVKVMIEIEKKTNAD